LVPSGLRAVVVPSGWSDTVQPHWWMATWWWKKHYADLWIMPMWLVKPLVAAVWAAERSA
jgi:hypothetical protein